MLDGVRAGREEWSRTWRAGMAHVDERPDDETGKQR
jgi:hypothetical protein